MQFLYVTTSESGLVKVGVSKSIDTRMNQIRTGSGLAVELIYSAGPFNAATQLEARIHRELKAHRTFGEWFACDAEAVLKVAEKCVSEFVDAPDNTEDEALAQEALIHAMVRQPLQATESKITHSIEELVARYAASVELNERVTTEFLEACDMLKWYEDSLKEAFAHIRKLQAELAESRSNQ